jgi:ABC-type glycerol-3-phosphate transport system substrate-binding protein
MLLQRHVNLIDQHNVVHLDDAKVLQTLLFYAQLVTGPRQIGAESSSGISGAWAQDLMGGNLCALFTPDWRANYVRNQAGPLAGKLKMMPLPRFDPDDAPTSTWGGTMIGIPRGCKNPDGAWNLIAFLYFNPEGLEARFRETHILPAVTSEWAKPIYRQPDPFFGGQKVFELYGTLATQIPPHYVTPATTLATAELSYVVNRAVGYTRAHGTDGLEEACRRWLAAAADDTRRRIAHAAF